MSKLTLLIVILSILGTLVLADIYMHNPRGSNNRLNEQSATRNANQRMFNSQNNNRGGYNVGDRSYQPSTTTGTATPNAPTSARPSHPFFRRPRSDPTANTCNVGSNEDDGQEQKQYQMVYLEGSHLQVEWTQQHGCGGNELDDPNKVNCQLVLQYICESSPITSKSTTKYPDSDGAEHGIWDGVEANQVDAANMNTRGYHESQSYYDHCDKRLRNRGLFVADRNMNGRSARFTRQQPNGNTAGFECEEERDYYPYWAPTPWRDIAVLTDQYKDPRACPYFQTNSQNVASKSACRNNGQTYTNQNANQNLIPIDSSQCEAKSTGAWVTRQPWGHPAPDCKPAPWSRDNHLGVGRDGQFNKYMWKLPTIADLEASNYKPHIYTDEFGVKSVKCALRIRYNISTDDYSPHPWDKNNEFIDFRYNGGNNFNFNDDRNNPNGTPLKQATDRPFYPPRPDANENSYYAQINGHGYDVTNARDDGTNGVPYYQPDGSLRLAVNTAQFFRVFEDRSHTFYIKERPTAWASKEIYNLNVKGKRGNIVETYPAMEYEFVPHDLKVKPNDLIHVQWTGSNTEQNNGNGGDGQTGDSGQGTTGTARHNIVQTLTYDMNYPIPLDKFPDNMFSRSQCYDIYGNYQNGVNPGTRAWGTMSDRAAVDCAVHLSTAGYYATRHEIFACKQQMQPTLNFSPASLIGGVVMEFAGVSGNPQTFIFLSTRNNAFTNRAQKGSITVEP